MSLSHKSFSIFKRDVLLFGTNLIAGIVVARTLGPTALGTWMILMLIPSYAEAFGRLKVDVGSVYFFGQNKFREQDILLSMNVITFISSGLLIVLILWQHEFLHQLLFSESEKGYHLHIFALLIQIPIQFLSLNYSYFHIAHENVIVYNRITIIQAWSYSIIAIGLLLLTSLELWSLIIASVVSITLSMFYGIWKVDRTSWGRALWNGSLSWNMICYGFNFYMGGILSQLHEQGTRTIMVAFLPSNQIAFLGQAQSFGILLNKVPNAINTILYPRISKLGGEDASEITSRTFRISLILLLIGGFLLGLIAEPLIILMYGVEFKTTATVIRFILPGVVIYGASNTLCSYFNGTGRANLIPKIQVLPVAVQMIIAFLLIRLWGLSGAALALSFGLGFYGIVLSVVYLKVSRTPFSSLLPSWLDIQQLFSFIRQILLSWKNAVI